MKEKQKIKSSPLFWIIITSCILIIGLIAYTSGLIYFSRSRQLTAMAQKVVSTNPKEISQIAIDQSHKPLKPKDLEPLTELYQTSPEKKELMREKVVDAADSGNVQIVKSGKILGIYPRYRLLIKPIMFTIKTNLDHPSFNIDENPIQFYGRKKKLTVKRLPGKYTFRCLGNSGKKKKDLKQSAVISPIGEQPVISFYVTPPAKKRKKVDVKQFIREYANPFNQESDDDILSFKETKDLPNDPSLRNSNNSSKGLVGIWKQVKGSIFKFNHNGTFTNTSNGNHNYGQYEIVYRDKDYLNIQFTHSNGTKTVQPFDLKNDHLIETNLRMKWKRA
ncbi:hypothetical protein [Xylocopilactobacillus apis]|uniref:Membrane protein n=1 Tax=Xylocopilactobacillus apis TaxID=2932183 RepID=A0AAU9D583_9LACO|nr:hypothetical protein [Xylocopilactobacillus apis]BDR56575.1 membrane protein [Xylocopilactobacillus apis]